MAANETGRPRGAARYGCLGAAIGAVVGTLCCTALVFGAGLSGADGTLPGWGTIWREVRGGFADGPGGVLFTLVGLALAAVVGAAPGTAVGAVLGWLVGRSRRGPEQAG